MNTYVTRTRNSLKITWANEAGDLWTVSKKFNLGTRELEDAQIECSRPDWPLEEGKQANRLADRMDTAFIVPEDFDRATISDRPPVKGDQATIWSRIGDKVYISVEKGEGE